jgi:hypothetical protein
MTVRNPDSFVDLATTETDFGRSKAPVWLCKPKAIAAGTELEQRDALPKKRRAKRGTLPTRSYAWRWGCT